MYTELYIAASALFIVSVAIYAYVCLLLSRDLANGVLPVRYEGDERS